MLPFNPPFKTSETLRKTFYPSNIYTTIAQVLQASLNQLSERNNVPSKHGFDRSAMQEIVPERNSF